MTILCGKNAVFESLKNERVQIRRLFLKKKNVLADEKLLDIFNIARKLKIKIVYPDEGFWKREFGDRPHQGVAVEFSEVPVEAISIQEFLDNRAEKNTRRIILLDGVTDPQNIGSVIRSAVFFGIDALVLPKDRSGKLNQTVMRVSAGAYAQLPVITVANINNTIRVLKESKFWVYGAVCGENAQPVDQINFDRNAAIVFGAEGEGIKPSTLKSCDFLVTIPGSGNFDSLNISVSAGIFLYCLTRKSS